MYIAPKKEHIELNVLGRFHLELCPPGVPGTEHDHLKDTREAGGAKRHTPAHALNLEHSLYSKSLRMSFSAKPAIAWVTPLEKYKQGVGYGQVFENQICGPYLCPGEQKGRYNGEEERTSSGFQLYPIIKKCYSCCQVFTGHPTASRRLLFIFVARDPWKYEAGIQWSMTAESQ